MPDLGYLALVLALPLALFGAVASIYGARQRQVAWVASGRNAVYAVSGLVAVAAVALWYALLTDDFAIEYVASHTERALPIYYKFSAFWGGQAGSLLFWTLILAGYSVVATTLFRHKQRELMPYVHATLLTTSAFFLALMIFTSNPFNRLAFLPADGQGLTPLLQNYWMVIHPIALYMGFVGFTIPYAFAVGALASGQISTSWVRLIRRWTFVPWLFLSIGILMGSNWAYSVLSFGGYWFWDAVENASFLPWLTATAFLHSIMITEQRGMLKQWNIILIMLTYELVLIGTFMTRSGVVDSVHAFALSNIGPFFVVFIAFTLFAFLYLLFNRQSSMQSENELDSMLSRESSFLYNNLLFVLVMGTTLLGTWFPVISEWVTSNKIAVSAPFFNKVNGPLFLGLLVLMGVAPLLSWRRSSPELLRKNFTLPLAFAALVLLAQIILGQRKPEVLVGFLVIAFTLGTIVQEFWRGLRARQTATGEDPFKAIANLFSRNARRYGGYTVHLGILLMATGMIGEGFFQSTTEANLKIGQSISVAGYTVTYQGLRQSPAPNFTRVFAVLSVQQNGRALGELLPERRLYNKAQDQPTNEVAIRSTLTEDLYAVLAGWDDNGNQASFRVIVNPLMMWLWLGGLVLILGTLISIWPHARAAVAATERVPRGALPQT